MNEKDIDKIRKDFPELNQNINGNQLVYLDNAATSLKPYNVIKGISDYYIGFNSNVHRAGHHLGTLATRAYEDARMKTAEFINADSSDEIIFTKGTTESINLLADVIGRHFLQEGDEIVLTVMEHHSNIVPWVSLKEKYNLNIKVIEIDETGILLVDDIDELWSDNTKVFSLCHSSNVLGTINPVKQLVASAKNRGILTVVDGAQAIVHTPVDVVDIGSDFYCFSGHKLYAPMGFGVLYGKKELLNALPPYQKGGGMIEKVSFDEIIFNTLPYKFEAGTPNVGGAIGLHKAIEYIEDIGFGNIIDREKALLAYATDRLKTIAGIEIYGQVQEKDPIVSFNIEGIHHYDMASILNMFGIAVRTGHHCAQPLMKKLGVGGTIRVSFSFYNTFEEIDYFIEKIKIAIDMLR